MNLNHITFRSEFRSDFDKIVKMTGEIFPEISTEQIIKDLMELSSHFMVAYNNDTPIGIVGYREEMKSFNVYEAYYCGVLPDYRKVGIGKLIAQTAFAKIKMLNTAISKGSTFVTIMTRPGYTKNFCVKLGFEVIHSIINEGETQYIMQMVM